MKQELSLNGSAHRNVSGCVPLGANLSTQRDDKYSTSGSDCRSECA